MRTFRIGIFRALNLGDLLCIIPSVRAIRKAYPKARITLIGLPRQQHFVKRFRHYFDDFMAFPGWPGLPEQPFDPPAIIEFLRRVQRKFDLLFNMHGNGPYTTCLCLLFHAKTIYGLRQSDGYCPDEKRFPVCDDNEHEVLRFLKLLKAAGIPADGTHLEFPISEKEKLSFNRTAEKIKLPMKKYICLHAGARDERRRWPIEKFAQVADALAAKGFIIVLTGAEEEKELLQRLSEEIQFPVINAIEHFEDSGPGELGAFIQHASLLITNDTGVSHMAAALGVSSIILFSPYSDIQRWAPLDHERHIALPPEKNSNPQEVIKIALACLKKST